ncbi:MAG: DNA primase small subunit domain-containing protein [Candidatus Anstonellales archaeon]
MEGIRDRAIVRNLFSEAYRNINIHIDEIEKREFGIGDFGKKIVYRHLAFRSESQLKNFLIERTPIYISYSISYYQHPDRPMDQKEYIRADFAIDIDESLDRLNIIKQDIFELYDILKSEFGLQRIVINYSGNRGFHIHVRDRWIQELSRDARSAIIDYLILRDVKIEDIGIIRKDNLLMGPRYENMKNRMQARLLRSIREITGNDRVYLGDWSDVDMQKFALAVERSRFRISMDSNVTLDQTKLLRMENSIHGDTGFIAKIIDINKLHDFDPWYDAVLFEDREIRVRMIEDYISKKYGVELKRDHSYRLKGDLGVFLLLSNRAKLI